MVIYCLLALSVRFPINIAFMDNCFYCFFFHFCFYFDFFRSWYTTQGWMAGIYELITFF